MYRDNAYTSHICLNTKMTDDAGTQNDYRQVSNIRRTLVGKKIVDHSDVVGASPVRLILEILR